MGDYNIHRPEILGNEWSPIRFNPYVLDHTVERGWSFRTEQARAFTDLRFHLHQDAPGRLTEQPVLATIYRRGSEVDIGPVRSVVVPVDAGTVTGSGVVLSTGTATVQEALAQPSDGKGIVFGGSTPLLFAGELNASFDTASVNTLLTGKRILNVSLLYTAGGPWEQQASVSYFQMVGLFSAGFDVAYGPGHMVTTAGSSELTDHIRRFSLGEVNPFWQAGAPSNTTERLPWRNTEIQRFEAGAANPIKFKIKCIAANAPVGVLSSSVLNYLALEITYCEENRELIGATAFGMEINSVNWGDNVQYTTGINNPNVITLRDPQTYAVNTILPAADYTATINVGDTGDMKHRQRVLFINSLTRPTINAIRELYTLEPQPAIEIRRPVQTSRTIERVESHIMPHMSINATGSANIDQAHAYGVQFPADVYDGISVAQDIVMLADDAASQYPWVRFYARRFGDDTQPLVLQRTSNPNQAVTLTPEAFDALPEIVDGWKEITLRFTTIPTFLTNGTGSEWQWVSAGTSATDMWQVLAAQGSLAQDNGTYGGDTTAILESPVGTAITNADATLFFAQDSPAVSGFALSQLSQPVTGIGLNCGVPPECIPSGIAYHQMTWNALTDFDNVVTDPFTRSTAGTWGATPEGWDYSESGAGGTVDAADFDTNGTTARHLMEASNIYRVSSLNDLILRDLEQIITFTLPANPTGASVEPANLIFRAEDINHYVLMRVEVNTANDVILKAYSSLSRELAVATVPGLTQSAGTAITVRAQVFGTTLRMRAWQTSLTEPTVWHLTATNPQVVKSGFVGVRTGIASGNSNAKPYTVVYDNWTINTFLDSFEYYEIQRSDPFDNEFKTIAKITDIGVTSFSDYEARISVQSDYRIRSCNRYDMCGQWSSTLSNTLTPGVFGTDASEGVLVFTSNEAQSGVYNLAYGMSWDDNPEEDFVFPEADQVRLQQMYGRDFQVAFRPLERGGQRFDRTLLVQAAAVASPVLERAFRSLRDMAWATVPYVCVRTEEGDRWFAAVIVPDGVIRRFRRLQLARVQIIEVTDTPSVVDL